jgi:hypothetical protein
MTKASLILLSMLSVAAFAQEEAEQAPGVISGGMDQEESAPHAQAQAAETATTVLNGAVEEPVAEGSREPAQDSIPGRPAKEDELRVLSQLPEASVRRDTRSMQNEVYKSIYNRELKQDQREDVLDE